MKNKPLSAYKKKKLIEAFCDELTATQAAHRLNLDRNTINKYFKRIRECIADYREYHKMRLLVSALKIPGQKPEVISKKISSPSSENPSFYVNVMHLGGQLLTELEALPGKETHAFLLNIGEYFSAPETISEVDQSSPALDDGELARLAEDFSLFALKRFKKHFGIKSDYTFLYLKEAEFVFNEKDPGMREKLLGKMTEKIFR